MRRYGEKLPSFASKKAELEQWRAAQLRGEAASAVRQGHPPIGRNMQSAEDFALMVEDLVGGVWILGKNGSGKTVTIERLATADIEVRRGCIVLDPAGDLTENLIARVPPQRVNDVILLDAGDADFLFGLNPVWCASPDDLDVVSAQSLRVRDAFKKVTSGWGAGMNDVIRNAAHVLFANPGHSLADFRRLFQDAEFRRPLLPQVKHPDVREFWAQEYEQLSEPQQRRLVDSTLSRVREFLSDSRLYSILSQSPQTVDFGRWINERKIVLVKLPPTALARDSLALLGALILQQVKEAAWSQVKRLPEQDRPLVPFYVDEFPRFATPDFGELFRELRKSGIVPVLAHQDLAQLPDDLASIPKAARHFFCFGVTGDDAPYAVREFHPERRKRDLPLSTNPLRDAGRFHQNPQVLQLVHTLAEGLDRAVVRTELAIRDAGDIPVMGAIRANRTSLENALNRYLVEAMRQGDPSLAPDYAFELDMELVFKESRRFERAEFMQAAKDLAAILADEPVYASTQDQVETAEDARRNLLSRLTAFNVFESYCKVEQNGVVTEQFVKMEPLPWVENTPELRAKRERIRENMVKRGITRKRSLQVDSGERTSAEAVATRAESKPAPIKRPGKARLDKD